MYDTMLWQKDMIASGIANIQTRISASRDPLVRQAYATLKKERKELSSVKLLEAEGHNQLAPVADRLEGQVNALELSLLSKSQTPRAINRFQGGRTCRAF